MRGAHVMLNPNLDYGKYFTAAEIERMLDGSIFALQHHVFEKETQVLIGQPEQYPSELVSAYYEYSPNTEMSGLPTWPISSIRNAANLRIR